MTKDIVIDTRCPVITIYLIPKGDRYIWSSGNNYGNFIGTARVRMNETVIAGKRTVYEVLRIMNTMNLQAGQLKAGMTLTE
jgi:hypothetical protein